MGVSPLLRQNHRSFPLGVLCFSSVTAARCAHTQKQVDFTPDNFVEPGDEPTPFPPAAFTPGSVGDEFYSPLVVINNIGGSVWNAPIIASGVDTEFLNQFCDMDSIPEDMAEEAYKCVTQVA